MNPEDAEQFRPAFEATIAIGIAEAGISLGPSPFTRDEDGSYANDELGLMWNGYTMGLVHGFMHGKGGPVVVEA